MKKSLITPLLFAAILFLLIRLVNDVPTGANYFAHSWGTMAIELTGIVVGSFLCHWLTREWVRFSVVRHIPSFVEYSVIILVPAIMCILVMSLSHDVPLMTELPNLIIPIVITVMMAIWLYFNLKSNFLHRLYTESRLKEQEAKQARAEADLKLLRAQFHPHFLFNMLNTIYFTIDEDNAKARDTVENLSNLLRMQLYKAEGKVALEREISALGSYLELCRVRFGDYMDISAQIAIDCGSVEIHPHLLLPLVENAVKHSGGNPRRVEVRLNQERNIVELSVKNTVSAHKVRHPKEESGLGLSNLRKRLELLYTDKYELTIENREHEYRACLKLDITNHG